MNSVSLLLRSRQICFSAARLTSRSVTTGCRNIRLDLSPRWQQSRLVWPPTSNSQSKYVSKHLTTSSSCQAERKKKNSQLQTRDCAETLTWRDYDPEGGLPFDGNDIIASEIHRIFGENYDIEVGNWIVRLVNYRRQSGSLIELGLDFSVEQHIKRHDAEKALQYLRRRQPDFDEQAAGRQWAEDQVQLLESEYLTRAQKYKLYEQPIQAPREDDSVLVNLRKQGEAKWRAEEEAEAAKSVEHTGKNEMASADGSNITRDITLSPPVQKAWLQPVERKPWVKYYEQQAHILNDKLVVPRRSAARRLAPSAAVVLLVLGCCVYLHENYTPPPSSARLFPSVTPTVATLGALVGSMVVVAIGYRMPPLWRFFNTYFITIPGYPAAVSMVLSTFTHTSLSHLMINTAMLVGFGGYLHDDVGRGTFLAIFFGTGAAATFASLALRVWRQQWMVYSYGASSAVYGVVAATCLVRANSDVSVLGYQIPAVGLLVLGIVTGFEILSSRFSLTAVGVDYAGHFAGLAGGSVAALLLRSGATKPAKKGQDTT